MRALLFTLLLIVGGAILPPTTPLSAQTNPSFDTAAHLRPGDVVRIQVWRQPEYSGEFEIMSDGTIAHPLFRTIPVAGRDLEAVERELHGFLEGLFDDPAFVVERFFQVVVGGEVRVPNVYPLRPETSIARAIALAGGPTERGNMQKVILRRGTEVHLLDLTSADTRLNEFEIRSGDEIVVERRRDVLREIVAPSASIISAVGWFLTILLR